MRRVALALAGVALAIGATSRPALADITAIRASDNAVALDLGFSRFQYRETVGGSVLDSEKKWLPTATVSARILAAGNAAGPLQNLYLGIDVQTSIGTATYDGARLDGTPLVGSTGERIQSVSGRIGHGFDLFGAALLVPFGEVGYRYWSRKLEGSGGYDEQYGNADAMLGLLGQVSPLPHLVISLEGAAGRTFAASMSAGAPFSATFNLGNETTWRLGGKLGYAITPRLELSGGVAYTQLRYGASGVVETGGGFFFEPDSRTRQTTLQIGLAYHFF